MAYAGALFADACLRGLNGDPDVIECSYVASNITEVPYFSSKVKLGKNGEYCGIIWQRVLRRGCNSVFWAVPVWSGPPASASGSVVAALASGSHLSSISPPVLSFLSAGVEQIYGLGELNDYEKAALKVGRTHSSMHGVNTLL